MVSLKRLAGDSMGTKKKRIQVYVNDATYGQIEGYAQERGVSISEAAGQLLSTQVVSAGATTMTDSQYVTRHELELQMQVMEAKYQAHCDQAIGFVAHQSKSAHEALLKGLDAKMEELRPALKLLASEEED